MTETADFSEIVSLPQAEDTYEGGNLWASLTPQPEAPVYDETAGISLSPSSIQEYMTCPRKFYYRHVLGLSATESASASLGLLIHRLMEVFNAGCRTGEPHSAERLTALAESLFSLSLPDLSEPDTPAPEAIETAIAEAGFLPEDIARLQTLDPLERKELQERLLASIRDLQAKGYFDAPVLEILSEEKFKDVQLPELPRCRLTAQIDALIRRDETAWDILDYKFYDDKKFAVEKDLNRRERLLNVFTPIPENAPEHASRFKVTEAKPRLYQLPLYYLVANADPRFAGNIRETALQLIRPEMPKNNGAIRISLVSEEIEVGKTQLLNDLNTYIVGPILAANTFPLNPSPQSCRQCGYLSICDSRGGEEEEDAGGEEPASETGGAS